MNDKNLKVALIREEVSVPQLCERIGIGTTSYYRKIKGETQFTQGEIAAITEALHLSRDEVFSIFFSGECPKGNEEETK